MTEYEFLDYQVSIGAVVNDSAVSFITVFFAYVVCAYLVGSKISFLQSAGLTFVYSVYSLLTIFGLGNNIAQLRELAIKYPEFYDDLDTLLAFLVGGPLALISAWLMSVVYMFVENGKRKSAERNEAI
jgi:hypothetical protein